MENFNAKCLQLVRQEDGTWKEIYHTVHTDNEMGDLVGKGVAQVDISKYIKLYYSTEGIEKMNGIYSKYTKEGIREFMASPLLLVECNDTLPIDFTQKAIDIIKENLIFLKKL